MGLLLGLSYCAGKTVQANQFRRELKKCEAILDNMNKILDEAKLDSELALGLAKAPDDEAEFEEQ